MSAPLTPAVEANAVTSARRMAPPVPTDFFAMEPRPVNRDNVPPERRIRLSAAVVLREAALARKPVLLFATNKEIPFLAMRRPNPTAPLVPMVSSAMEPKLVNRDNVLPEHPIH